MASSFGIFLKSAIKAVSSMDIYSIAAKIGLSSIDDIVNAAAQGTAKSLTVVIDDVVVTAKVTSEGIEINQSGNKNIKPEDTIFVKNTETGEVKNIQFSEYLESRHLTKEQFKKLKHYTFQEYANSIEITQILGIGKGSLKNKAILIPGIVTASVLYPPLIPAALIAGGAYLSLEAVEAIKEQVEERFKNKEEHDEGHNKDEVKEHKTVKELTQDKIDEAVKTDFVLSAEILIIALGAMGPVAPVAAVTALVGVGVAATVGVYGVVAGVVKIDDLGLKMQQQKNKIIQKTGTFLVDKFTPKFLETLEFIGIAAMAAVGGSLLLHNVHMLHPIAETIEKMNIFASIGSEIGVGAVLGGVTFAAVETFHAIDHKLGIIKGIKSIKDKILPKKEIKENIEQEEEQVEESQDEIQKMIEESKVESSVKQNKIDNNNNLKISVSEKQEQTNSMLDKLKTFLEKKMKSINSLISSKEKSVDSIHSQELGD